LRKEYPNQEVEQVTIVVGATSVFHKWSQIEYVKATRLQKNDLARWQRNVVGVALHGSYQIFHESMEKAKCNKKLPPTAEITASLEEHEVDLMPDADENSIGADEFLDEEITGIEAYQASVAVREVEIEEKHPIPALKAHPDGHRDSERLASLQRALDQLQELKRASRSHEHFTAMDSTCEYKTTPAMKRSLSAERLDTLGAFRVGPAQVKITLCIGGNRENVICVSERTSMYDLRRIASNHFQGSLGGGAMGLSKPALPRVRFP
jgi:hypothetical protein